MSCMIYEMKAKDMPLGVVLLSLDGFWYGSNVHAIHLTTDSRLWGCDLRRRPLSLTRGTCMFCGCFVSLTSPPWVPYFMCLLLLSSGRLGPSRAEVFAVLGWFRRFRLPPSAGLVPCPSASAFLFPCPFGFARSGPGVSCWCSLCPSSFAFPPGYFLCRGSTRKFFAPWTSCGSSTTRPQLIA